MVAMGKIHTQLGIKARRMIQELYGSGYSQKRIAERLGVHKSTISREIRRNWDKGTRTYNYAVADALCRQRRPRIGSKIERSKDLQTLIKDQLAMGRSPEVIAGRLKLETGSHVISHESIYQWLYDPRTDSSLRAKLLRAKRKRGWRPSRRKEVTIIPDRVSIHDRPDIKGEFGHWEGDTVIFKGHQGCILTLYERISKVFLCAKLTNKEAQIVTKAIERLLSPLPPEARLSTTYDNGGEFAGHKALDFLMKSYFCDPYSSWQKGGVEKVNGILRRYVPKGSKADDYTEGEIESIMWHINQTPRKSLGYRTPYEVFEAMVKKASQRLEAAL